MKVGWRTQPVLLTETPTADKTRSTGRLWREWGPGQTFGTANTKGAGAGSSQRAEGAGTLGSEGREGVRGPGTCARAAWRSSTGGRGRWTSKQKGHTGYHAQKQGETKRKEFTLQSGEREKTLGCSQMEENGGREEIQCREERFLRGGHKTTGGQRARRSQ